MSDTPRTDAAKFFSDIGGWVTPASKFMQLERELNAANERIEALNRGNANAERILCDLTGCESGRDVPDSIVAANERIKRLEREIELFREHVDYGDVSLVEAILKGEEIGRKEKEAKP
jgi:hypothetical protein